MHVHESETIPLSPDAVRELMTSEDFQRVKADRVGASEFSMQVNESPSLTVVTRRKISTANMPEFIKPMINPTITVTETERWTTASEGDFEVDVKGAPISVRGTVRLVPVEGGAELTFTGELRSSVPLFRQKIEESAAASVIDTIKSEFHLLRETAEHAED